MLGIEMDVMKGPSVQAPLMLIVITFVFEDFAAITTLLHLNYAASSPEHTCFFATGIKPFQLCHSTIDSLATFAS